MNLFQSGDAVRPAQLGPYRLDEPLGAGGMGRVWRAWDERLQRGVAIKELRSDGRVSKLRERLRREARAAARLNHPSIVHIYDIIEDRGGDWIVMELVQGVTLRRLLDEQGPLSVLQAAQLGREIAEGLAEAHAQGVLHRDLKASNIMVTPSGRAKILDFGLAKELPREDKPAQEEQSLSAPGTILGTCHAMSPEQVLGEPLDVRSDLFSLGSLLYEALSGNAPFRGESATASLGKVLSFEPQPLHGILAQVPLELSRLVERMLQKDVRLRPGSAREVVEALTGILADLGPSSSAERPAHERSRPLPLDATMMTHDQRPRGASSILESTAGPEGHRPPSSAERPRQIGERRSLSVVCCGLVEIDQVSGEARSLDLEILSEVMAAFQDLGREVCEPLEGQIGTSLGNLLWLYFGYPRAHEDDAERAVRSARELVARTGELVHALDDPPVGRLAVRAAVHTGPAVISARPGRRAEPQLGTTLDLSTALQNTAPAGGVVVSAASQRLIAGSFETEALPSIQVPGAPEPVAVFRVTGAVAVRNRTGNALAPLVGRERDLDLLLDRFRLARSGHGQAVMISGEAGIGKSRLLRELRQSLEGDAPRWMVGYGSPYTQSTPLAPIVHLLESNLFLEAREAPAKQKLDLLEEVLRQHGLLPADSVPLLAPLLSLPMGERYPPVALSPEVQRRRTLETVVALLGQMAERQPLVLIVEDLHWIDPSTLEFLGLLLAEIAALPLLLLLTFRPAFQAPWGHRADISQLSLSRLGDHEVEALIEHIGNRSELPRDILRQIVLRTDGVPLFAEELTKTVLESGWSRESRELPSTLSGSLMARLDRTGTAKEVAQLASVIGRTFSLDLLAAISRLDRQELQQGLDELLQAEVIYRRGLGPRARFFFRHALLQDAAYASLLARDRQELHLEIASTLEARAGAEGVQPEVIARHSTAGQDYEKALGYWLQAGQTALARFANLEAVEHFQQGLAVLGSLPAGTDRDRREIGLQSLLSMALTLTRGHAAPEVESAYGRVLELGDRLGAIPQDILPGLCAHYNARGELHRALRLAEQMMQNAEAPGMEATFGFALCSFATTQFFLGNLETARAGYERLLFLFPVDGDDPLASNLGYGFDPRLLALGHLGMTRWIMGSPDSGVELSHRSLALARKIGEPFSIGLGLLEEVNLTLSMRDYPAARQHARELLDLCREQAFHAWATIAELALGCAEAALQSSREEARRALQPAIKAFKTLRTAYGQSLDNVRYAAWLVEAAREDFEDLIAQSLADVERRGERFWEPELHRLQGELVLGQGREAEPSFQRALAAARQLGALSLELRAAISLSRLLHGQGRSEEAGELLASLLDQFTEGWDTPDLRKAVALRDILRSA